MKNLTTEELAKTYYQAMKQAFEAGNHKEFLSLFTELSKTSQEPLVAVHKIQSEEGKKPFTLAFLTAVEAKYAWMCKRLTTAKTYDVVDGKDFVTTTHTWENHSETTTARVSEGEYMRWYNDGLITQSELYSKLESLKKGN